MAMDSIKIFSLNAKGLNITEKRRMLLNGLKRSQAQIYLTFIQETHFRPDRPPCLKNRFYPLSYHATNMEAKSKGVSILLSIKLPWTCHETLIDSDSRYVFLKGSFGNIWVTPAAVYVPNDHQDIFIRRVLDTLFKFSEGQLILGIDFNIPLRPASVTSSKVSSVCSGIHRKITQYLHRAKMVDVWRLQHSGEKDYTFYSSVHKV